MAETGIIEIDGQRMKKCPGWDGNSFRCGKGNPRLIREDAEVCENCSRGMRKRGQQTRKEQEEAERKEREKKAKLERAVEIFAGKLDVEDPLPLDPEAGRKVAIREAIESLEALTQGDVGETYSYWKDRPISSEQKIEILREWSGAGAGDPDEFEA